MKICLSGWKGSRSTLSYDKVQLLVLNFDLIRINFVEGPENEVQNIFVSLWECSFLWYMRKVILLVYGVSLEEMTSHPQAQEKAPNVKSQSKGDGVD